MTTKLLLADDSVTIHKVVGLTFAAEDVRIETVTDGGKALEKVRAEKPDIVLADVFMPELSGYQLCETMKSDPELALIPVVLLVGSFEPFDEDEASRVQCDAYLTKPFDTNELVKIVRHLTNRYQEAKSARSGSRAAAGGTSALPAAVPAGGTRTSGLVSERTRASFLGPARILDLFGGVMPVPESAAPPTAESAAKETEATAPSRVIQFPKEQIDSAAQDRAAILDEPTLHRIVEMVVRRMSDKVVREIAWEVVPEVSEVIIRHYIDDLCPKKP